MEWSPATKRNKETSQQRKWVEYVSYYKSNPIIRLKWVNWDYKQNQRLSHSCVHDIIGSKLKLLYN